MTPRELMTDYLAAAKRGDWDTAFGFLADDLLIHIPGRSAFAGQRFGGRDLLHVVDGGVPAWARRGWALVR